MNSPSGERPGPSTMAWIALAAIVLVNAAVYRDVVGHGFVLDDSHAVRENAAIRSFTGAVSAFFSAHAASGTPEYRNYRPVTVVSYALDDALWGEKPGGFHATNLLIHLGVVCLTFVLGRRVWRHNVGGLVAAGVVALHPINAEAVNYIAARSSSLMTLFLLAAVYAVDRAGPERKRPVLLLAYVLGLLALGTKEAAVVLPAIVLIWSRMAWGEREAMTWRSVVPWCVLTGGYLGIRAWVFSVAQAGHVNVDFPWFQDGLFSLKIYLASWGHWMWPVGLAADHAWPSVMTPAEGWYLVAGVALACAATVWVLRRSQRVGWCLVWFWVAMAPAGAVPFVARMTLYQDHRVYLGGIALAWLAGGAVMWMVRVSARSRPTRAVVMVGLMLLTAAAGWADVARTKAWTGPEALWDDILRSYPDSVLARTAKGALALEAGRLDEARDRLEAALRLAPGYSVARHNLGVVFLRQGDLDSAVAQWESALRVHPHYTPAALSLGEAYERMGDEQAIRLYERLVQRDPLWVAVLLRYAALLEREGRLEDAVARYRAVQTIEPSNEDALVGLGSVLIKTRQWGAAREVFAAFLASHPSSFGAHFYLGMTHAREGQDESALRHWLEAVRLDPEDSELWYELGLLHARGGRWRDAAVAFEAVLIRDPSHAFAHFNLAVVAEQAHDAGRALQHYGVVASGTTDDGLRAKAIGAITRLGGSQAAAVGRRVP